MQFDARRSHSHRGFSPVVAAGLLTWRTVLTVFFRSLCESRWNGCLGCALSADHRAEATVWIKRQTAGTEVKGKKEIASYEWWVGNWGRESRGGFALKSRRSRRMTIAHRFIGGFERCQNSSPWSGRLSLNVQYELDLLRPLRARNILSIGSRGVALRAYPG